MAIEGVSSVSQTPPAYLTGAAPSRPPETVPDAREAASQQNDARRIAEASRGSSPQYLSGPNGENIPATGGARMDVSSVANDPEGSIQRAQTVIQSANASGAPSEAETRAAAEAYRAASSAQSDLARQQQGQGTRTMDVLA